MSTAHLDNRRQDGLLAIPARINVYELSSEECVVVASDGQQWRIAASLAVIRSQHGQKALNELRTHANALSSPARGWGERLAPSASALTDIAAEVKRNGVIATVMFPFSGHWHRVQLALGEAVSVAQTAIECLLATIPDAAVAAALIHPADLQDPLPSWSHEDTPPVTAGALERWVNGAWQIHCLIPARVADPLTGILHRIVRRPSTPPLPTGFVHLHAELPYLGSIDPRYQPDLLAPAGALDDGNSTAVELREPGILSGIAHYCGTNLGQGTRKRASAVEIERGCQRWFDLRNWEPHDPTLHVIPGFPFARFDPRRTGEWILGQDADGDVWVPLSLVHAGYLREGDEPAAATNANNLVGLHAGRSWEEAVERACGHLVAHDAVAVWWSSTAVAEETAVPTSVRQVFRSSPLNVHILVIPSTFAVPVRLAVLDDASDNIISLGIAAHMAPERAGELAVVEALIQHASARDLADETSLIRNSAALGNGAVAGLADFDLARGYARAFGEDHRGLIDPMAHIQYGLDPKVVAHTRARLTAGGYASASNPSPSAIASTLEAVTSLICVDVTTERVRSTGFHAARVLAPGLARLQPAAFPLDPTGRVIRAREILGWRENPHREPYPGW